MRKTIRLRRKKIVSIGLKPLLICLIILLNGLISAILAQGFDITGTVKDKQGVPIPGANVVVKGEFKGVVTDLSGDFLLRLDKGHQIEISFIGYNTQTIYAKNEQHFDIVLEEGANELEEVVVIGYGEQKVKNATYSVASISLKRIEDIPATNLGTLIRDQIPGVAVTGGEARPGDAASIEIRQTFSWSKDGGYANPLIVIDDVPQIDVVTGNPTLSTFNDLDASEIESITVLKDAAASIYGSRAAQGAILVKTKRGELGKPKISYSGKFAFNDAISHSKTMNTNEYGLFANSYLRSLGVNRADFLFSDEELEQMKSLDYNWLEEGWKPAHIYQHSLNISGGTESINYFTGGSYTTQTANMGEDNYSRWNFRSSVDATVANGLKLGVTISANKENSVKPYTKTISRLGDNSYGQAGQGIPDYTYMLHTPKYIPWSWEYEDGEEYYVSPALGPAQNSSSADVNRQIASWNYFAMIESGSLSTSESGSYSANFSIKYDVPFIKGLQIRGTYVTEFGSSMVEQVQKPYTLLRATNTNQLGTHLYGEHTIWRSPQVIGMNTNDNGARVVYEDSEDISYQANAYITYARTIGLHEISAMATAERSERSARNARQLYHDPLEAYGGTSATAGTLFNDHTLIRRYESGSMSYAGRLSYAYADKYLAQFVIRSDASTKFAPENYWGTFPSVSFGWVPSEENFFHNNISWIDFLKLRYSVGIVGKDNIKAWRWMQTYRWDGEKGYYFGTNGGVFSTSLLPGPSPNRLLRWDKTLKQNIGVDATVLDNRLSMTYEFFHDKNKEMLMSRADEVGVPITVGGAVAEENFGEIWSWGHEMSLSWREKRGDFFYSVRANFQLGYDNIIKKYKKTSLEYPSSNNMRVGYSTIFPEWGFLVWQGTSTGDGILRTEEDIQNYWAYLTANAEAAGTTPVFLGKRTMSELRPGMLVYQDIGGLMNDSTGTQTGPNGQIVKDQDYARLVKRSYGHSVRTSFDVSWKSLSLLAALNLSWGTYRKIDVVRQLNQANYMLWNREPFWTDMFDAETNPDGKYPNLATDNLHYSSDFWQLPSFRAYIRTLTIAYTLPLQYSKKIRIEKIRVNITGNNLWDLYNPYPGKYRNMYDASTVSYPTLRTWTFGINVTF